VDTFDRKGRLLSRADPLGNTVSFTYDARGNVVSKTEPLGWKTTFAYDDRSNLIAETNALGLVRRWLIHPTYNKPVEAIDPLNWSTYFVYDTAGNMVTNFDTLGVLARHTYFANGLAETSADGNGNTTRFTYTPDGFLAVKTDPASNVWRYGYNELGWPLAVTNPLDQVTTFAYDLNGRQVRATDPLRTFTKSFDANGNLLSETDAKGAVTRYAYDAANQRTQMVDRVGQPWAYTYTTRGSLWTSRDPLGATFTRAYDNANRLTSVTDPLTNVESMEYNANGSIVATVDKLGRRYTKTYDRLNRVIAETDPLGNTKTTSFDAVGRVKTVTTPNGFTSTHDYDGRGRLVRWLDAEGFEWGYAYDGIANITNITDALSGHYIMSYGSRNERTLERNQDGFEWRYLYDELLRLKQQTDPNGTTRNIEYDAGGRVDYVWFSTGRTDDYQYNDTSDNISGLSRSSPTPPTSCSFAYDSMDRVTEYTDPFSKKVKYAYDSAGRLAAVTHPDNKVVTNRYDLLGRLEKQTDWATREINYAWDKANRLVTRQYPNGITQTNAYDAAGRLTSLSYLRSSGNALIALEYAFDRNGNKTSHLEKGTLNWALPARIDEHAVYTPAGRLVDRNDALNPTNSFTYAYDAAGNMTSAVSVAESYAFTYDEDNRVLSVAWRTNGVTRTIQNRFDALGRRVSKKDNGVETRYVLDLSAKMERILCDMNASSQITAWYVHGPDLSYRVDSGGSLSVYLADAQANVIAVADANTNLVTTYAYTPYGRLLGVSGGQSDPFRFVGSQGVMQDLPDLYFMRARYYSANAALFLSVDPVKNIGPTWRPSAYGYAAANPMTFVDPHGLLSIKSAWNAVKSWVQKAVSSVKQTVSNLAAKAATSVAKSNVTKKAGGGTSTKIGGGGSGDGGGKEGSGEEKPAFSISDLVKWVFSPTYNVFSPVSPLNYAMSSSGIGDYFDIRATVDLGVARMGNSEVTGGEIQTGLFSQPSYKLPGSYTDKDSIHSPQASLPSGEIQACVLNRCLGVGVGFGSAVPVDASLKLDGTDSTLRVSGGLFDVVDVSYEAPVRDFLWADVFALPILMR
jgi:RHS repeat-associated protein